MLARGGLAQWHLLPEEVGQLLRGVGVAAGDLEQLPDSRLLDVTPGSPEPACNEGREGAWLDRPQLDRLRTAPERLVGVAEDLRHDVALAAEVDVRHLGLLLEDRAQEPRQFGIDLHDLLELIEDQRGSPPTCPAELGRQVKQALQRRVDVGVAPAEGEAEPERAVLGVDRDGGLDLQAPKRGEGPLPDPLERRGDLLVDRAGERRRQPLLVRRRHQVDLGHQDALACQRLACAPDQ